jgi:hypothetical protein
VNSGNSQRGGWPTKPLSPCPPICGSRRPSPAPGWSTARRIAEALGVTLKELAEAVEAEDSEGA